jgi:hypothetical protein
VAENEIQTADGSDGVTNKSEQQLNRPPAKSSKKTSSKRSGSSAQRSGSKSVPPKVNERGVAVTNWDNPDNDPNKRQHVGETGPTGEGNKLK